MTLQTIRNRDCPNLHQSDIRRGSPDSQSRLRPAASKVAFPCSNSKHAQRTGRKAPSSRHARASEAMPGELPKNHTHETRQARAVGAYWRSSSALTRGLSNESECAV